MWAYWLNILLYVILLTKDLKKIKHKKKNIVKRKIIRSREKYYEI